MRPNARVMAQIGRMGVAILLWWKLLKDIPYLLSRKFQLLIQPSLLMSQMADSVLAQVDPLQREFDEGLNSSEL
jgi:hypothetical protein